MGTRISKTMAESTAVDKNPATSDENTPAPGEQHEEEANPSMGGSKLPEFPESLDQYPKPPNPNNRSADFENVLAYMYQAQVAREKGELPPACGYGRYLGVNPQGEP